MLPVSYTQIDVSDAIPDDLSVEDKIVHLENVRVRLFGKREDLLKKIDAANDMLRRETPLLSKEFEFNEATIAALQAEINDFRVENFLSEDDTDLDEFELDEDPDSILESAEQQAEVISLSRQVKYLFNKIAMKCHPDRTDDKVLHSIFHKAHLAKKANDVQMLTILWDAVSKRSNLMIALLQRYAELTAEVESLKSEISEIEAGTALQFARLVEHAPVKAVELHRNHLKMSVMKQMDIIAELRSELFKLKFN